MTYMVMLEKAFALFGISLFFIPLMAQRTEYPLDGEWKFKIDPDSIGYRSWHKGLNKAESVIVPHTWNVDVQYEKYIGTAWYEKTLSVPNMWKGKKIRLLFDAVYRDAIVYINGKKIGINKGCGYTPFSFDITDYLLYGKINKIILSVSNHYSDYAFPYKKHFDWSNDGGIIRPVKLIITDGIPVRYAHVRPTIQFKDSSATASVTIKLWDEKTKDLNIKLSFAEWQKDQTVLSKEIQLKRNLNGVFVADVQFDKIKPWHFDSPQLYVMKVEVQGKYGIQGIYTTRFGFRKVVVKDDQLFLNEEAVRLPGVEYMAGSVPIYGMAEPLDIQQKVVKLMKDLNCVLTRFHWQQDTRILNLMDEQGILVQEEIPWWQAPGDLTPQLEELAKRHVDQMIERDLNHPCIFSWGISNEVFYNTNKDIYRRLIAHARSWDSRRLVTIVSNEIFDRLQNDESLLGDMPTWNDYVGTWHGESKEETAEKLALINNKALCGRPLLITEHGLCEPHFTGGDSRRITDMTYHYDLWKKNKYIAGCIYFSLNDYRTHMGETGDGRYKTRVHGLTDLWLNPKTSYSAYKMLAAPIYIENVHQVGRRAVVTLAVKNTLPSYTLRHYILLWEDVQNRKKELFLPVLRPGDKYKIVLEDLSVDEEVNLKIIRPTGNVVIEY